MARESKRLHSAETGTRGESGGCEVGWMIDDWPRKSHSFLVRRSAVVTEV